MPTIDGDFKKQGGRVAGARGTPDMKKGYSADMQCGMERQVHIKWHMRLFLLVRFKRWHNT